MVNLEDAVLNRSSIKEVNIGELIVQAKDPKLIGRVFSYFAEDAAKSNKKQEEYAFKVKSVEQKLKKEMKDAVFMLQGELYFKDGLYEKAEERFLEAIKQNPRNEFAHAKRSLALAEWFKEKYHKLKKYAKLKMKEKKYADIYDFKGGNAKYKRDKYHDKAEDCAKLNNLEFLVYLLHPYRDNNLEKWIFVCLDSAISINPKNRKIRKIRKKTLSNNLHKKLEEIMGKLKKL